MAYLVAAYRGLRDRTTPERRLARRFIGAQLPRTPIPPGFILDIGGGTAPFRRSVTAALPGRNYIVVDLHDHEEVAVVADAARLPFEDGTAGLLTFFQVLHHVADPSEVLAEARRVSAPDGCILLTYPFLSPEGATSDLRRWTSTGMAAELARAGFEPVTQQCWGGIAFLATQLVASVPERFLVRHRKGWRTGRGVADAVRLALAFTLALPWHLLGFLALMIDRLIPTQPYNTGGIILARRCADD
jgi:SAM-dependent methyltransferase